MSDYLVEHARRAVWCTPAQDHTYRVVPHRLTPSSGAINTFTVMGRTLRTPKAGPRYHLFQIGQLYPTVLGLLPRTPDWQSEQWQDFATCCNQTKLWVDIYTETGLQLPRYAAHYLFTNERNLLIAIEALAPMPIAYGRERIYLRVYRNAYYQSLRSDQFATAIRIEGSTITSLDALWSWQAKYAEWITASSGATLVFVNGRLRHTLDGSTAPVGSVVECVYDSAIKRIVTLPINQLPYFDSTLDAVRKYLVHYPATLPALIDYIDDIDIYVVNQAPSGRFTGMYYHTNRPSNARMVTHRDYAVRVDAVEYFSNQVASLTDEATVPENQLHLQLYVRHAGYARPLVFEHQRIHELYKLSDTDLVGALVGPQSVVPLWHAAALEESAYCALMSADPTAITAARVRDAYGYNALSVLFGNTPHPPVVVGALRSIDVPYGLQQRATAYEYDSAGLLLGVAPHALGRTYTAAYTDTCLIELLSGAGSAAPNTVFGRTDLPIPTKASYRVYGCTSPDLGYEAMWTDLTDHPDCQIVNQRLHWTGAATTLLQVRTDLDFLAFDLHVEPTDGNLRFSLAAVDARAGTPELTVLQVPYGEMDVFLNGHSLIADLDYTVRFPEVVILNKTFLTSNPNTTEQWIHVRCMGFCDADGASQVNDDRGFIEHGVLSNNRRYDLRDDRVLRLVVNGALRPRDAVVFSEHHLGVSVVNALNGQPYSLRDLVVPMTAWIEQDTYVARTRSQAVDQTVSDYLTLKLPQPVRDGVSAIEAPYPVVSPFLAKVLYDLFTTHLDPTAVLLAVTDQQILALCAPYEDWLEFDPLHPNRTLNNRYVTIHPHNHSNTVPLPPSAYRFFQQVVRLYARGLVDITGFVTITTPL